MTNLELGGWVQEQLVETLAGIQLEGKREVTAISENTVPFDHLPGFDSLNGVEAAVVLSERLHVEIDEIKFVAPKDGRRLTVSEIVAAIVKDYGPELRARALGGIGSASFPGTSPNLAERVP